MSEKPQYPSAQNIAIASTGDPEEDARLIEEFVIHEKRMIEGICPNGCAPLELPERGVEKCPKCGFVRHTFALHV